MKIKDMMHKGVECVAPNATLQQIVKKMKDFDVGAIPVCEGDKAIGMVTDRDIAMSLADGKDVSKISASDLMSKNVIYCRDTEEAEDAIRIMEKKSDPPTACAQRGAETRRHGEPRRHFPRPIAGPHRRGNEGRLGPSQLRFKRPISDALP